MVIGIGGVPTIMVQALEQEDVRGAFLTTRPKPVDKGKGSVTPRAARRRPKNVPAKPTDPGGGTTPGGTATPDTTGKRPHRSLAWA